MALTNIEYGSLANSETLNNNFEYLESKINQTSETIMTSISSLLSNIATINSRLNDLTEDVDNSTEELNSRIDMYKAKTKALVNKATLMPKWSGIISVSFEDAFICPSQGFLMLIPEASSKGTLTINNKTVVFKTTSNDSICEISQLGLLPLADGDVVTTTMQINRAYFLPAKEISVENF